MAEASAARLRRTKNAIAAGAPSGMRAKASGSVTNMRPGPLEGSSPSVKTTGNTARPARQEMAVSLRIVTIATVRRSKSGPA